MNIHRNNKMISSSSTTSKTTMMRSTALTIFLVHIMYISFARGFILPSTSSSSLQHRHNALYATRQDDMLATGSTRAFTTTSPRRRPTPSRSTTNNNNQYTQFFKENVLVGIERTSPNSRRISGEMIINIPIDTIWNILTDYDNLSVHVPNLVESRVISTRGTSSSPRVYQRGAQRIFGFEFGADVTMDMMEHVHLLTSSSTAAVDDEGTSKQCVIDFKCVDSQFFSEFDGSWIVEEYKDDDGVSPPSDGAPITMVRYVVDVRPKGPVPVAALEWRIKEDVPVNILAVSKAATAAMARQQTEQQQQQSVVANVVPQVPLSAQPPSTPSFPRRRRSPRQATLQPLQRLTNQAANNFKRTAKSVLPSPLYSSAKQIFNNLPRPRRNDAPTMSLQTGSDIETETTLTSVTSKDMDVDWYDDETMAMYL
mmetsp:Transcript_29312/g.45341  ORF Transcript_29312/g.45341 Transcript_29312/m.45341 type:complete len:425 (-) Transcript_29312:62-1336(-)